MDNFSESIDRILMVLREEPNPSRCFDKIIAVASAGTPSKIWDTFARMDLHRDIAEAKVWLQGIADEHLQFNGIYFGLDTLNMCEAEGFNVDLGLGNTCDPTTFEQGWCFECYHYGEEYLIKSLSDVEASFSSDHWSYEERSAAEYIIFLGFSGIIFREALLALETSNDFGSLWGFHDGDMYNLVRKIGDSRVIIAK